MLEHPFYIRILHLNQDINIAGQMSKLGHFGHLSLLCSYKTQNTTKVTKHNYVSVIKDVTWLPDLIKQIISPESDRFICNKFQY